MKQHMFLLLGLAVTFQLFHSCISKPFDGFDYSDKSYKLCFVVQPGETSLIYMNEFQKEYGNFYIDDVQVLEAFDDRFIGNKSIGTRDYKSFYFVWLVQQGSIKEQCLLDLENNAIIFNGQKFKFYFTKFEQSSKYYKEFDSYGVQCTTHSSTREVINFVKASNGLIFGNQKIIDHIINDFEGKVVLLTDTLNFHQFMSSDFEIIENKVSQDLNNIGQVLLTEYSYHGNDSVFITILCEQDFTHCLPIEYKIFKPYTDTTDLQFWVYNIAEEKLIDFIQKNHIGDCFIRSLN